MPEARGVAADEDGVAGPLLAGAEVECGVDGQDPLDVEGGAVLAQDPDGRGLPLHVGHLDDRDVLLGAGLELLRDVHHAAHGGSGWLAWF